MFGARRNDQNTYFRSLLTDSLETALPGSKNKLQAPFEPGHPDKNVESSILVAFSPSNSETRGLSTSKPRLKYFSARAIKQSINPEGIGDVYAEDVDVIEEKYQEWREFTEYVVVRRDDEFLCIEARKRGNDKYNRLLQFKISELTKYLKRRSLSALSITLTNDPGRYSGHPYEDRFYAWQELGKRFNRFMSWIRRRYGKVYFFRVWESFTNGYPHVHLLLFSERKFYIPQYKMCKIWGAHTWIRRVRSVPRMMRYLTKYLVKTYTKEDHLPTAARLWYHQLRSFSISEMSGLHLIPTKHYSNVDLMAEDIQKGEWVLVGIMTYEEIKTNIRVGVVKFV